MNLVFEPLCETDLEETYKLCMESFNEGFTLDEIKKTWELCKNDSHYHFIVGKLDGKIVAYTTMIIFHNLFDGLRPLATLWYVCVDKDYRRRGIASEMFKEMERIAKEQNVEIVYFTSEWNNIGAHEFYRSQGYADTEEKAFVKYLFEED